MGNQSRTSPDRGIEPFISLEFFVPLIRPELKNFQCGINPNLKHSKISHDLEFSFERVVNLRKAFMADEVYIHYYGCIDHLCFYRMWNKDFVRMKSTLTRKRVKSDPAFAKTMQEANLLGRASKIVSVVYKALPKEFRQFWMYRAFTGEIVMMLKNGKTGKEAEEIMQQVYVSVWNCKAGNNTIKIKRSPAKVVALIQRTERREFNCIRRDFLNVRHIRPGKQLVFMTGVGPPSDLVA